MFDPTINLDPFDPPVRARPCPRCIVTNAGGRLFVETINATQRKAWCDECDWHQIYTPAGPQPAIEPRDEKTTARQWNRAGLPPKPTDKSPTNTESAMPERQTKECPKCHQHTKVIKKSTGWCCKCTRDVPCAKVSNAVTATATGNASVNPDAIIADLLKKSCDFRAAAKAIADLYGVPMPADEAA